jgi:Zn-dependent protease
MDFSPERIRILVEGLIILVLSITVHEFGHAYVADRLGDRLPRQQGRVTLNPASHADPIGTLLIPGLGLLFGGLMFGWGRPVQVSPASFSRRFSMRVGHLMVAAAGPLMNIGFALVISLILFGLYRSQVLVAEPNSLYQSLSLAIYLNFGLAIFNLVPAPPLDGGTVLAGVLPRRMMPAYHRYAQYSVFLVIAFFMIPALSAIVRVPARFLYHSWANGVLGLPVL